MFDCHVHTTFSGDSSIDPFIACDTAIERGLKGFSVTDHYDPDYPNMTDYYFEVDFDQYCKKIDEMREKYKGKLMVVKGIELGLQDHTMLESSKLIDQFKMEYVIASFHVIDRLELHSGDFTNDKTKFEAYERYFKEACRIIRKYDNYDVLGHLDIIRRYGNYDSKACCYNDFSDVIDEILKEAIQKGKGIEINTSGYRYNLGTPMPSMDIVKRFKELGGEIICLGSDAHNAEHIRYKFDEVAENLKNIGIKYLSYFINRKPEFYKL